MFKSFRKKGYAKKILFFLVWLLLVKFFSTIFEITNTHSYFTIIIQAIILFLPFGLTIMHFIVCFIKACFNGAIKSFSLDYGELSIIVFIVCFIGYIKLKNVLFEWLYEVLLNVYGLESVVHSLPERFLIQYFLNIINDTESELYFLLLPL